jgi:mRNA interferase MazF
MTEGDIVIARIPQSDSALKNRPTIVLREMKPFGDFLLRGISTQFHQQVKGFDEIIATDDDDFVSSGLVSDSLIRLGFLPTTPRTSIMGKIGFISPERHERLLKNLSDYLLDAVK